MLMLIDNNNWFDKCFDAVGSVMGLRPVSSATAIPNSLLLGTSLTRSNQTWNNLGKMGRVKQKWRVCVIMIDQYYTNYFSLSKSDTLKTV